jgi:hypothetical protein
MASRKKRAVSRQGASRKGAPGKRAARPEAAGPIIKRPDGYYWEARPGELRGPYDTREEAELERIAGGFAGNGEDDFEAGETLQEAESEIGVSEWIDPDTGGPAEDNVPRIEDH